MRGGIDRGGWWWGILVRGVALPARPSLSASPWNAGTREAHPKRKIRTRVKSMNEYAEAIATEDLNNQLGPPCPTHHLIFPPSIATGIPLRINKAPNTPKAGSILIPNGI